jgi:hypothetical protein
VDARETYAHTPVPVTMVHTWTIEEFLFK